MGSIEPISAWSWWERRRLPYNVALTVAGALAYLATLCVFLAFGRLPFSDFRGFFGLTLLFVAGFLLIVGCANICYLLGAIAESLIALENRGLFRIHTYALGFWGSMALLFFLSVIVLALFLVQVPA